MLDCKRSILEFGLFNDSVIFGGILMLNIYAFKYNLDAILAIVELTGQVLTLLKINSSEIVGPNLARFGLLLNQGRLSLIRIYLTQLRQI